MDDYDYFDPELDAEYQAMWEWKQHEVNDRFEDMTPVRL